MPYLFLFSLLLLLLLSEPLSVTASYDSGVRLYVRLIFFGMIVSLFGHTEKKKQRKKKKGEKKAPSAAKARRRRLLALLDALRHLIPRATLVLDGVPSPNGAAPLAVGTGYAALSLLYAMLSSLFSHTEVRVAEDTGTRLTLRVCLLDVLWAAILFASSYIKRKKMYGTNTHE